MKTEIVFYNGKTLDGYASEIIIKDAVDVLSLGKFLSENKAEKTAELGNIKLVMVDNAAWNLITADIVFLLNEMGYITSILREDEIMNNNLTVSSTTNREKILSELISQNVAFGQDESEKKERILEAKQTDAKVVRDLRSIEGDSSTTQDDISGEDDVDEV